MAYYGLWLPLEKLRQQCGVNRDGSNAKKILIAARNLNCTAKAFTWNVDKIKEKNFFPLIIHWEFNHFVVLEGFKADKFYLNDPALGKRQIPLEEFKTSYTGVCLRIIPKENFKPSGRRYNVFKEIAKKLYEDKYAALFAMILGFCMIVPGLAQPVFNQIFLDDILTNCHPDWLSKLCSAVAVSMVLSCAMNWMRAVLLTQWQKKLTLVDSSQFFLHLLKLPIQFFQQRQAAEVASRIGFNESVAGVLSGSAATAILDFFVAIFYLFLLLQYSVILTLIGLFFSIMDLLLLAFMRRKLTDLTLKIQQDKGKKFGTLMNGLLMIETIKANGGESDFFTKWAGYRAKVIVDSQELQLWSTKVKLLPNLLSSLNGALIMMLGGFSIMEEVQ